MEAIDPQAEVATIRALQWDQHPAALEALIKRMGEKLTQMEADSERMRRDLAEMRVKMRGF